MTHITSRRNFLKVGATLSAATFLGGFSKTILAQEITKASSLMGFNAISASTADNVIVPEGYTARVLLSWGDPLFPNAPAFLDDSSNTSADQALQFGDNADGMQYFDVKDGYGVLAINNEYVNPQHLYQHDQYKAQSAEEVLKAQNAVGLSIVGLQRDGLTGMTFDINSTYNRRITAHTPMIISGPAAAHKDLQTKADPKGMYVLGTQNNCSSGKTPWGTYVTCEENFDDFFGASDEKNITADMKRYGIKSESRYGWEKFDDRFDISKHPNEFNRFGWIVEIDPLNPEHTPIKRTALGRFKHENAALTVAKDGRVVVYMGDDERGEHIYKFITKRAFIEGNTAHNMTLLDEGTLYVGLFEGGDTPNQGHGKWVELTHGKNGLTAENGFESQADIAIYTRKAADHVNATTMDRPEWIAVNPINGKVFCTLTNNSKRGDKFAPNAANPREKNIYGQIIRWEEKGGDHSAETFTWDMYVMAGNPNVYPSHDPRAGSANITKENTFNSPDGIGFDSAGRIWILTDGKYTNTGDFSGQGNNAMLCGDPESGEIRRFLTGPKSCEVTGLTWANNERTMFVNIQHPGEKNDSTFPHTGKTPRSSVIMITKNDGGVIGS